MNNERILDVSLRRDRQVIVFKELKINLVMAGDYPCKKAGFTQNNACRIIYNIMIHLLS